MICESCGAPEASKVYLTTDIDNDSHEWLCGRCQTYLRPVWCKDEEPEVLAAALEEELDVELQADMILRRRPQWTQ